MGFYDTYKSDSIFKNHNDNLTIYCYKDSLAAKYAIKYNIKYIYLSKDETKNNIDNVTSNETQNNQTTTKNTTSNNTTTKDTTIKSGVLPNTGIKIGTFIVFLILISVGIFTYYKYNNLKDVK